MISIKSRIIGAAGYYLCRTNFINPVLSPAGPVTEKWSCPTKN